MLCVGRDEGWPKFYFFDRDFRLLRINRDSQAAPEDFTLPKPAGLDEAFAIADRLSKGFQQFGKYSHGFLTNEAAMIGVETRTSAPVRIVRAEATLQHVRVKGLFP